MKLNLIEVEVIVKKHKRVLDIDFEKLLKCVAGDSDLNNLSEEEKENIICEFESSNKSNYLKECCGITFEDLPDEETAGFDIEDNMEEIQRLEKEFAEFVYNYGTENNSVDYKR